MAQTGIPGLDVYERFGGPRTASPAGGWAPGSSPQAQKWQGLRSPPTPPTEGSVARALRSVPGTLAEGTTPMGGALRAGGAAVAGAPEALKVGKVLANPNTTALDVGTQAGEGVTKLATAGLGATTGAALGTAAAPLLGPLAPAGPVLGGLAGGIYGYYAGDKAIRGLRTQFGLDPRGPAETMPPPPAAYSAGSAGAPGSSSSAPNAVDTTSYRTEGANRPLRSMPPVPDQPSSDNVVTRANNSFSGKNVREGWRYADGSEPKYGVTVVPGMGREEAALRAAALPQTRRELDAYEGFATPGVGGFGGRTLSSGLREIADSQPSASVLNNDGLSGRQREQFRVAREGQRIQREGQGLNYDAALRGQDVQARGQDVNASTAMRGQDVQARGQDLSYDASMYGTDMSARGTRAQLAQQRATSLRDQYNKDRDFLAAQTERDRTAAEASDTALTKQLETRYRTTDDKGNNVPDANKVAAYKRAAASTIPALADMLRKTGSEEAARKAAELEKRGPSALTPSDHDMMQRLFDQRDIMRQSYGFLPGASDFVESDNLLDYMQAGGDKGVYRGLTGQRVRTVNGSTVDVDKLKYGPSGNTVWWNMGPANANNVRGLRGLE